MKTVFSLTLLMTSLASTAMAHWPFGTFDNGLTDVETLEDKAELLKDLEYDGIAWRPGRTAEMRRALEARNLSLFASYVVLRATPEACPIPTDIESEIRALRGSDAIVWLTIRGNTSDAIALEAIRSVSKIADEEGLRVALYPHHNFNTDTVAKCMEYIRALDLPNLGITFNLCHFLRQNDASALESTLRAAGPKLYLVSLNGANGGDTQAMGWGQLIQPLGSGSFPTETLLPILKEIGYYGPILLQCYNIKEPAAKHLKTSMEAWKAMLRQAPAR